MKFLELRFNLVIETKLSHLKQEAPNLSFAFVRARQSSSVMHTSLSFEPLRCSPTRLRQHSGFSPTLRAYTSH